MQVQNDTFELFLRRTDALADYLDLRIEDLPPVLGISRASMFGYRGGKRAISKKAWLKLQHAEERAGLRVTQVREHHSAPTYGEMESNVRKALLGRYPQLRAWERKALVLREQGMEIETLLEDAYQNRKDPEEVLRLLAERVLPHLSPADTAKVQAAFAEAQRIRDQLEGGDALRAGES